MDSPSDDIKNETNAEGQPEQRTIMEIILNRDGSMQVKSLFLKDKEKCYEILKYAADTISKDVNQLPKKINIKGIMNFVRNGKH